ncbi:MAG: Gfo/Idh/MocA family protein [Nanobdellota archaeon]
MEKQKFALIGCGGYIAPRHLKAIKETNNELVVALDIHDSVGILDKFSRDVKFFTEFERFDRHCEKIKRDETKKVDWVSICSPNYLHDSHIRFGLRIGANVICEKPIVLNPRNIENIMELEKETGKKVYTVLQLRYHPTIKSLKEKYPIEKFGDNEKIDIDLTYITPRGNWYFHSWKGDISKSGGVATNIGIHFFDMLTWIFGEVESQKVFLKEEQKMSGYIELKHAKVRWYLSLDRNDLPEINKEENKPFRSIKINGEELEFSNGFTDLHTEVYEKTLLEGKGFRISDALPSIKIVHDIRTIHISEIEKDKVHPKALNLL